MLWLLLILGCGFDEDKFLDKYVAELCSVEDECFRENFIVAYENDMEICLEETALSLQADGTERECVGFSADHAKDCLDSLKDKDVTCRTFQSGVFDSTSCDAVYLCAFEPEETTTDAPE